MFMFAADGESGGNALAYSKSLRVRRVLKRQGEGRALHASVSCAPRLLVQDVRGEKRGKRSKLLAIDVPSLPKCPKCWIEMLSGFASGFDVSAFTHATPAPPHPSRRHAVRNFLPHIHLA